MWTKSEWNSSISTAFSMCGVVGKRGSGGVEVRRKLGMKYGKAATLLSRGLVGVRMKGDRRWAGYLDK